MTVENSSRTRSRDWHQHPIDHPANPNRFRIREILYQLCVGFQDLAKLRELVRTTIAEETKRTTINFVPRSRAKRRDASEKRELLNPVLNRGEAAAGVKEHGHSS